MPITIKGLQNVINFVDGYSKRLEYYGFRFNDSSHREIDPETGRLMNWQLETERTINRVYTGLGLNNVPGQFQGATNQLTVNPATSILTQTVGAQPYLLGQDVYVFANGVLPTPLMHNVKYYVIPSTQPNQFQLATTIENAQAGIAISITDIGAGILFYGAFETSQHQSARYVELNPFRFNLWVHTPKGIVSNALRGPYEDIRIEQTLYDQYGRPFREKDTNIYRQDLLTRINIDDELYNDVTGDNNVDSLDTLHLGGGHIFIDAYEHVVLFNDYTVDNALMYDAFVGLHTPRFAMSFIRQSEKTQRPSVGGYTFNGTDLVRNIEGSVEDMQKFYDTYTVSETSDNIEYARQTLGYNNLDYLDHLGVSDKSKFIFWRGMIQQKGSINAVNAFINSIQFIDAKVDEYWTYKIAEYGDAREESYPAVKLKIEDARRNDIRFQFVDDVEADSTFDPITVDDTDRWIDLPDVKAQFPNNLSFESQVHHRYEYRIVSGELHELVNGEWITLLTTAGMISLSSPADVIEVTSPTGLPSNIVTYVGPEAIHIQDLSVDGEFFVYSKMPAKAALNPSKIIDYRSNVTIMNVPMWDPARSIHYHNAIQIVDTSHPADPSVYTTDREQPAAG
jgi:hypothetical protein